VPSCDHVARMPRRRPRLAPAVLVLVATLLLAAPVGAQTDSEQREAAEETLEQAQQLAEGHGVRTGRELSAALAELTARRSSLSRADRKEADRLLARPTDAAGDGVTAPYDPTARVWRNCSTHFCIHWVDSSNDAPSPANADSCPTPDYIDEMRRAFEQSYDVENGQLAWKAPESDGGAGGDTRTDVYVKDIGDEGFFGYAAADPGQPDPRVKHAFQVMDDDYAPEEFEYDDPTVPMRVTAAHEYNHILQYGYDALQDIWMFESTAVWAEDKVFDGINDWFFYMPNWAELPDQPITYAGDGADPQDDDLKMYGSGIWNHWVERKYGAATVRRAWEDSKPPTGDDFAPGAYERAIQLAGHPTATFASVFAEFAAATAEWQVTDSGIHEGATFSAPPVSVPGVTPRPAMTFGVPATFTIDHTAFRLQNVPVPSPGAPADVRLVGSLKPGVDGSIALVGRTAAGEVTKVMDDFGAGGSAEVTLPNAAGYLRITAVLVNADTGNIGFDEGIGDWDWTGDDAPGSLTVSRATGAPGQVVDEPDPERASPGAAPTSDCGTTSVEREPAVVTPTPTPSVSPTPTPSVTPPPPPPPPATSVRLSRSSTLLATIARKGVLSFFVRTNKAGRVTAKATVDRTTARRLRVGRRTTTVGTGRRTASAPARLKVNVRLTRKLRAALKRSTRSVTIKVRVTFVPADGTSTVRRAISIRLRR
jgi:hypothetical protein